MITNNEKINVLLKVKAAIVGGNTRVEREAFEKLVRAEVAALKEDEKVAYLDAEIAKIPVEDVDRG